MTKGFVSQVASHSEEFLLERDISTVFPLFTPEGEKLWAPGWTYTNLIGSVELKPDYVFLKSREGDVAENRYFTEGRDLG